MGKSLDSVEGDLVVAPPGEELLGAEHVGDGSVLANFGVVEEGVPAEGAVLNAGIAVELGESLLVMLVGTSAGSPVIDLISDELVFG